MNDNSHTIRMVESIKAVIGDKEANEFEEKYPLSKSANLNRKFEWAKEACEYWVVRRKAFKATSEYADENSYYNKGAF